MRNLPRQVEARLTKSAIDFLVHDHDDVASCRPIDSPADFAAHLGYALTRITKTVIVKKQRAAAPYVAVVAPMTERIDFTKLSRVLGFRAEVASAAELEDATSYPKFGVSPVGLSPDLRVIISKSVMGSPTILVGGGCVGLEIELTPDDLVRTTAGVVTDVSKRE